METTSLEHESAEANLDEDEAVRPEKSPAAKIFTHPIFWLLLMLLVLGGIAFAVVAAGSANALDSCGGG